jgi:Amt family ammonium transporter
MVNGIWGTLSVGLFSTGADGVSPGLFYGGGLHQLGIQALGFSSVILYVLVIMLVVFKLIDRTIGLRVPAQVEIDGLDIHEHGLVSAYSGFAISDVTETGMLENENTDLGEDSAEKATPAQLGAAVKVFRQPEVPAPASTGMYKVVMIVKLSKFDTLKTALNNLGVTGMTVSQVMGCGIQRGTTEKYRGVPVDSTLLPKVKVEVVVSKLPVDAVIAAAKSALYTGHIGDGKIFVYPVSRVVKVRTNEENFAALQDVE